MVTGEVTGSTVTPNLEQNKVMILNGPVFLWEHRPIVLQSFLSDFCLTFTDLHHWVMWGNARRDHRITFFFSGVASAFHNNAHLNEIELKMKHRAGAPFKMRALTTFTEGVEITNDMPPLYSWVTFNAQGFRGVQMHAWWLLPSRLLCRSHSDALHVFVVSEKALKLSRCVPEDNKKVLNWGV